MQNKKIFIYSLTVSLILHLVFFAGSTKVKLSGIYTFLEESKKFFNLKAVDIEIPKARPFIKRGVTYTQSLKFQQPEYSKIEIKSDKPSRKKIKSKQELPGRREKKKLSLPEEKYLEETAKIPSQEKKLRKTQVELVQFSKEGMRTFSADDLEKVIKQAKLPDEFKDKMPGFTPAQTGGFLENLKYRFFGKLSPGYKPFTAKEGKLKDLEGYLVSNLSTYQDPKTKENYFKLTVRAGPDAEVLGLFPKEMIFLIDSSLSIRSPRLSQIKKGIIYWLEHLSVDDRFNIISFRDNIEKLSQKSLKPTKGNIEKAKDFIDQIRASKRTDVYNALAEAIRANSVVSPSYIILFSDGYPTKGIINPTKIISNISRKNNAKKAIFSFAAGKEINRYLLDFISYKNRGWTEYAHTEDGVKEKMEKMHNKVKDPILINVRYNLKGIDSNEVFPQALHDIYLNTEFTLYGKYHQQDKFALQLIGDSRKAINEFMVVALLQEARQGSRSIAKEWALNKIYYLTGLLNYGEYNQKIIKEIKELSKKFKINTPYIYNIGPRD